MQFSSGARILCFTRIVKQLHSNDPQHKSTTHDHKTRQMTYRNIIDQLMLFIKQFKNK